MRRGELRLVAGGVHAPKPRPALIVQSDLFPTESVTVCPLTTTEVHAPLLRLPVPADETTGITRASFATIDELTTVRRTQVTERVGRPPPRLLVEFERRALVFLGFGG